VPYSPKKWAKVENRPVLEGAVMKTKKVLKRLAKIEALISNLAEQYSATAPNIREALRDAKAGVTRAKKTLSSQASSGTAKKPPVRQSKPTSKAAPQPSTAKRQLRAAGPKSIKNATANKAVMKKAAVKKATLVKAATALGQKAAKRVPAKRVWAERVPATKAAVKEAAEKRILAKTTAATKAAVKTPVKNASARRVSAREAVARPPAKEAPTMVQEPEGPASLDTESTISEQAEQETPVQEVGAK